VSAGDQVDVEVRSGDARRVVVRAGEKVIGDVRTEVRDGVLYVSYDGPGVRDGRLLVEATVTQLDGIEVTGRGDVRARELDARELDLRVTGAGDLDAAGRVDRLDADVEGAGDADLGELEARAARIEVNGSGDADVHATERLDAAVRGAGDLEYRGDPALRQRVTGSGELQQVG